MSASFLTHPDFKGQCLVVETDRQASQQSGQVDGKCKIITMPAIKEVESSTVRDVPPGMQGLGTRRRQNSDSETVFRPGDKLITIRSDEIGILKHGGDET
jgi:hypothetical protein